MAAYVRFETPFRCERHGRPLGLFWAVRWIEMRADVSGWTQELLRESLDWFNQHLPAPRSAEMDHRAIFWFHRQSAAVREMWQLVSIFREEGIPTVLRRTGIPGRIVYRDDFQIAAIPYGHGRHRRKR
jgi:hypothetical protein